MKVKTVFGIDTNGNDIFVIQKANMFKILTERPTEEEWSEISIEFNLSFDEINELKTDFDEWKEWYRKAK